MRWFRLGRGERDWMQTFSGVHYYPAHPRVEDVCILDIAHALSNLCRYTGHVRKFYSVAEHCVLVSQVVPPEFAFIGLMHDAPEFVLNDLNRPTKHLPWLWGYRRIEARNWKVIAEKFGLPLVLPPEIHQADIGVLLAEQAVLMLPRTSSQGVVGVPADVPIACWPPEVAEKMFLDRFYELTRGCGYVVLPTRYEILNDKWTFKVETK
jgi:hypothetical protein